MNKCQKDDIVKSWKMVELELWIYNSGEFSAYYFLRQIISFLRTNPDFCKDKEYKELYDECIVLLTLHNHACSDWTHDAPTDQQGTIEFLIDLETHHTCNDNDRFDYHTVKKYLDHRRKRWKNGDIYTKEQYGFI